MIYQLSWKILPGLRGISCSDFRAMRTATPDNQQGVAVECAGDAERDALLRELDESFGPQRFSNSAAAFEAVKAFVLDWAAQRQQL